MFSPRLYLTGKPDYIVKNNKTYLPIEIKSGQYHHPQFHHILQLAAYCALIEDSYNTFVPQGVLVYPTGQHMIQFTPSLRFQLEKILQEMKANTRHHQVTRNHNTREKCKACSLQQYCPDKLF